MEEPRSHRVRGTVDLYVHLRTRLGPPSTVVETGVPDHLPVSTHPTRGTSEVSVPTRRTGAKNSSVNLQCVPNGVPTLVCRCPSGSVVPTRSVPTRRPRCHP